MAVTKRKITKKVIRKSRSSSKPAVKTGKYRNIKLFAFLFVSLFTIFITINQFQQHQALRQLAHTTNQGVKTPPFGCLGVGNVTCSEMDSFDSIPIQVGVGTGDGTGTGA